MANSCREGAGSSETYTCSKEASALFLYFQTTSQQTVNQIQMVNTTMDSALTDIFILLLSTKLLLIIWTRNINQLVSVCKSCVLTLKLYGRLITDFPTCQFRTNYHGHAPHINTAGRRKTVSQTFLTSENQDNNGATFSLRVGSRITMHV